MENGKLSRRRGERGQAMVEVCLLSPWIFLLFMGVLDAGFYAYASICTQNAARAGAIRTSGIGSQSLKQACLAATPEMNNLPNLVGYSGTCSAAPLTVTQTTLTTTCPDYDPTNDSAVQCSQVAVTYQSPQLFPIPFLMGKLSLTRVAEARIFTP